MMVFYKKIELSEHQYNLLKLLKKEGAAEFRDNYESLEDFLKSEDYISGRRTIESYKARNFCDMKDIYHLDFNGLVECDDWSWHMTYRISDLGKDLLDGKLDKQ
jgi:hypothetical protein